MNNQAIISCIVKIMQEELGIYPNEQINETMRLDDLGIDSIGLMTLSVYLEESFEIDISSDLFAKEPQVVRDVVDIVTKAYTIKANE